MAFFRDSDTAPWGDTACVVAVTTPVARFMLVLGVQRYRNFGSYRLSSLAAWVLSVLSLVRCVNSVKVSILKEMYDTRLLSRWRYSTRGRYSFVMLLLLLLLWLALCSTATVLSRYRTVHCR